jgi:hypothetical protein
MPKNEPYALICKYETLGHSACFEFFGPRAEEAILEHIAYTGKED